MRILNRNVYVGPSQYAHFPVIRLQLDLGALEAWPTAKLGDAFIDGLIAAVVTGPGPDIITPCGGCRQKLREFSIPEELVIIAGDPGGIR